MKFKSSQKFSIKDTPTNKAKKKYTLMGAISMLVGSVIGIGIFFKNGQVLNASGSGLISIIGWLVGGLVVFASVYCFTEMFSSKKQTNKGLAKAAEVYNHPWLSRTFTWFFKVLYFPLLNMVLAYYISWFMWPIFDIDPTTVHPFAQFGMTFVLLSWFFFLNGGWIKGGERHQKVITVIKLIPFVIIAMVALSSKRLLTNNFTVAVAQSASDSPFGIEGKGFLGFMLALPPILFAYDGFQDVVNMKGDMINPKKNVPKAYMLGILTVILVYTSIAISIFTYAPDGSVLTFAQNAFSGWFTKIIQIVIFISATGGLNKFSIVYPRFSRENALEKEHLFSNFVAKSRKKTGTPIGGAIWHFSVAVLYILFIVIVNAFQSINGDPISSASLAVLIDTVSNWNSVLLFALTSILIFVALLYRMKKRPMDVFERKMRFFVPMGWLTVIATTIIAFFNFGYTAYLAATGTGKVAESNLVLVIVIVVFIAIMAMGPFMINSIKTYYKLNEESTKWYRVKKCLKIGFGTIKDEDILKKIHALNNQQ